MPTLHLNTLFALSKPDKLRILRWLTDHGPSTSVQLQHALGVSRQSLSHHLTTLHEAGLLRMRPHGRTRMWTLDPAPLHAVRDWAARIERAQHLRGGGGDCEPDDWGTECAVVQTGD